MDRQTIFGSPEELRTIVQCPTPQYLLRYSQLYLWLQTLQTPCSH